MLRTGQSVLVLMMVVVASTMSWATDGRAHQKAINASGEVVKALPPPTVKQEQSAFPPGAKRMSPRPAEVTYVNGQLTIAAENSSLADILSAVCAQTGISVELPPGAESDRVAIRMGPGPARDVLAALLNGSSFDYIMTGSLSHPDGVDHIILILRADGSDRVSLMDNTANDGTVARHLPQQNEVGTGSSHPQRSQQDVKEANATSDDAAEGGDDSEQPTRVMISEAEEPSERDSELQSPQMQQLLGTSPQQPASSPGALPGVPNLPPHN